MKTNIKIRFLLPTLIAALNLLPARPAAAQTFATLHSFTNSPDGSFPENGSLISSGNFLYGTAFGGGNAGNGTVFAINTNGMGFTNFYSFTATSYNNNTGRQTNSDGAGPAAGLILSGNTLYGTAEYGGTNAAGTVFAVNTDGTGFTNLHCFTGYPRDGANPTAGLILSGNTLYGTALYGGTNGTGMVFAINTDGTGYTNLHSFTATDPTTLTNRDGAYPVGGLVLSGNTLYGTAEYGGSSGWGAVFAVNRDGTDFTNLHSFTYSDGAYPVAGLIISGNTLYGTANQGGGDNKGTVFALSINGANITILHSFTNGPSGGAGEYPGGINPAAGLILSGNTLYGTASGGGSYNSGAVFGINTNGFGFTNLYSFTAGIQVYNPSTFTFQYTNSDGANPQAGLTLLGNTLYGTAYDGGSSAYGTVFSLSLAAAGGSPPTLNLNRSGTNVILAWSASGFTLQSTTNLASPQWTTVSGQNAVTNPISGTQMFYRLSQ